MTSTATLASSSDVFQRVSQAPAIRHVVSARATRPHFGQVQWNFNGIPVRKLIVELYMTVEWGSGLHSRFGRCCPAEPTIIKLKFGFDWVGSGWSKQDHTTRRGLITRRSDYWFVQWHRAIKSCTETSFCCTAIVVGFRADGERHAQRPLTFARRVWMRPESHL